MFDRFWLATNKNFAGLNLQPISASKMETSHFWPQNRFFLTSWKTQNVFDEQLLHVATCFKACASSGAFLEALG